MKALVLDDKNQPLIIRDLPDPQPGADEAVVRVHAAALNHRDLWIQKGQYAGLRYPAVLGSDGAGKVTATGSNVHAHWINKAVIINPALNWGDDFSYQDTKNFKILGLPDAGTFAEYVKIPVSNLFEKPVHLSFEEAAALPLAGLTAYRALFTRAHLQPNNQLLITGIGGGVASFALQFALAIHAAVYVSSGSEDKIKKAVALGAIAGANYKNDNWDDELLKQAGNFHVILDGAAGEGMGRLLNLAAPGGRIVFYGATRGNPTHIEARRIFWKQLNVLGSTMGSPADFQSMLDFVNEHHISPLVDEIFPFAEGENALRRMDDAGQFGKIVIKMI